MPEPTIPYRRTSLHLRIAALTGTAKHLRDVHGLDPGLIDTDDPHGLAHDHAVLHGAKVTSAGSYRLAAPLPAHGGVGDLPWDDDVRPDQ